MTLLCHAAPVHSLTPCTYHNQLNKKVNDGLSPSQTGFLLLYSINTMLWLVASLWRLKERENSGWWLAWHEMHRVTRKGAERMNEKTRKKNKQKNTKRRERKEKIWEKKFECLCVWTYADNIQQHIHVTYKPVYTCIAAAAAAVEAAAVELTWRLS